MHLLPTPPPLSPSETLSDGERKNGNAGKSKDVQKANKGEQEKLISTKKKKKEEEKVLKKSKKQNKSQTPKSGKNGDITPILAHEVLLKEEDIEDDDEMDNLVSEVNEVNDKQDCYMSKDKSLPLHSNVINTTYGNRSCNAHSEQPVVLSDYKSIEMTSVHSPPKIEVSISSNPQKKKQSNVKNKVGKKEHSDNDDKSDSEDSDDSSED